MSFTTEKNAVSLLTTEPWDGKNRCLEWGPPAYLQRLQTQVAEAASSEAGLSSQGT